MVVCYSLSRAKRLHSLDSAESSPIENDPYFSYVPEPANKIFFQMGPHCKTLLALNSQISRSVNHVLIPPTSLHMQLDSDSAYEGDNDLPQVKCSNTKQKYAARGKTQGKYLKVSGKVKSHRLATEPQSPENLPISDNEQDKQYSPGDSQANSYTQRNATQVEGNAHSILCKQLHILTYQMLLK